jgi:hypothetical protein
MINSSAQNFLFNNYAQNKKLLLQFRLFLVIYFGFKLIKTHLKFIKKVHIRLCFYYIKMKNTRALCVGKQLLENQKSKQIKLYLRL